MSVNTTYHMPVAQGRGSLGNMHMSFIYYISQNPFLPFILNFIYLFVVLSHLYYMIMPVSIELVSGEVVKTYNNLWLQVVNKLDWTANTDALYNKEQSRLFPEKALV